MQKVILKDSELAYENDILGMWDINHYITLLMGEIPRLSDNPDGYGPKGKDFIAHVSISDEVNLAFSELKKRILRNGSYCKPIIRFQKLNKL